MKKIKAVLATVLVCSLLIVSSSGVWAKNNASINETTIVNKPNISLLGDPAPVGM